MKNPYDSYDTVATYENAWSYPEDAISRLASLINENYDCKQDIRILDIGIGTGSLSLNLARKLIDKPNIQSCYVNAFDKSEHMISESKKNSKRLGVGCTAIVHDAREGLPKEFNETNYDIVIITFVLHYLDDLDDSGSLASWQKLLKQAAARLRDGGLLIQAEVLGEMGAVDGLAPLNIAGGEIESAFTDFWKYYFNDLRSPKWETVLRPSSYQKVFEWIAGQNSGEDLPLMPFYGFAYEDEHSLELETMLAWISSGQFSSLSTGLESSLRETYTANMRDYATKKRNINKFKINRSARFVLHQKTPCKFMAYYTASWAFYTYIDRHGIYALPLGKEAKLPIDGNQLKVEGEDKKAMIAFLEEFVIPVIGADFFTCELCLYDFIDSQDWGAVARVRPEYRESRDEYAKQIKNTSFIELVYKKKIFQNRDPSLIRVSVKRDSLPVLHLLGKSRKGDWEEYIPNDGEKVSISHHQTLLGQNNSMYIYYIMTTFCPTSREDSSERMISLSVGSLIFASTSDIEIAILRLLHIAVSELTNPIGAAYLRAVQLKQTERSSRAAVFARNFSHITGSHIVSNPEFRHSLVGNELMRVFRSRLDQNIDNLKAAENNLLKFMIDDNKSPEHAFSAAAKELADVRDKLGTGDVLLENTRRFHEYLQGRFDFIARAIDDLKDPPEPVWFVKDLLEGFLNQTAYLDNLVADVGLRREDMEISLRVCDKDNDIDYDEYVATWAPQGEATDSVQYPLEVIWKISGNPRVGAPERPEKMVSLPGGMGSAHAFYSLLENIIRNSAKYGTSKEERAKGKYKLTVRISSMNSTNDDPAYQLISIWDNYSLAKHEKSPTYKEIQKKLEKNFVRDEGQAEIDDLGMMEMQACAKFLCREDDKGLYPGKRPDHVIKENATQDEPKRFNLWTSSLKKSKNIDPNNPPLVFQMAFNKTTLMAFCTPKSKVRSYTQEFELVSCVDQLSEVRGLSPFLLVLDGSQPSSHIVESLAQDQTAFPQRIVVVCSDDQQHSEWTESLEKSRLPRRRIVCLQDEGIHKIIFSTSPNYDEENAILAGYKAWLKAWKPPPPNPNPANPADKKSGQWHLWIGLQRQGIQVQEAWENADKYFSDDSLVRVMVASFSAKDNAPFKSKSTEPIYKVGEREYWQVERKALAKCKRALVFDNHGNCFQAAQIGVDSLRTSTRFYQKLSGSVSPDLFRLLSSPPKDEFSFRFFVYSLVESCLTNVLVVDERLAMSLLESNGNEKINDSFGSDLLEHQNAGIYPVFRFRHETDPPNDQKIGFYTQRHRERLDAIIAKQISESDHKEIMEQEGVIFAANEKSDIKGEYKLLTPDSQNKLMLSNCREADVILIHEGAMDILVAEGVDWKGIENRKQLLKQLKALYQLAPLIIRTSGRGRKSKLLGEHLPFIEFTQVSSALLTARNKFSLVRALLGSVGRAMK